MHDHMISPTLPPGFRRKALATAIVSAFAMAPAAQAVEITAEVNYSLDGGANVQDIDGPDIGAPNSVDVLASASSATSNVFYHTYGNTAGTFGSRVDGSGWFDITGEFTYKDTIVNNTLINQSYSFNFTVIPGEIRVNTNTAPLGPGETLFANYSIDIQADGSTIWDSSAFVSIDDGTNGPTFMDTGSNSLGGTPTVSPGLAAYSWGTFTDTVDLGVLAPGETLDLEYDLLAHAMGNVTSFDCSGGGFNGEGGQEPVGMPAINGGEGCGALARSGDPLGIGGGNSLGAVTSAAAPEPATLALLGTGLLGFAATRRRR